MSKSKFILNHRKYLIRRLLSKNLLLRFQASSKSNKRIDVCDLFDSSQLPDVAKGVSADKFLQNLMEQKEATITLPGESNVGGRIIKIKKENDEIQRTTGLPSLFCAWPFVCVPRQNAKPLSAPLLFWRLKNIAISGRSLTVGMPDDEAPIYNFILEEWLKNYHGLSLDFSRIISEDEQGESITMNPDVAIEKIGDIAAEWDGCENKLSACAPYHLHKYEDGDHGLSILPCAVIGVAYFKYLTLLRDLDALQKKANNNDNCGLLDEFYHPSDDIRNPPRGEVPTESEKYLVEQTDVSQEQAVWQARKSKVMLLKGPPGTGKSQTIVNLIGDALKRRESVALVCRKQAALDVVKKRLKGAGLGHLTVKIIEPRAQRKDVITELRKIRDGDVNGGYHIKKREQERSDCSEIIAQHESQGDGIAVSRGEGESYSVYGHLRGVIARIQEDTKFNLSRPKHKKFVQRMSAIAIDFSPDALKHKMEELKRLAEDCERCNYADNKWKNAGVDETDASDIIQSFRALIEDAEQLDEQRANLPSESFRGLLFNLAMRDFAVQLFCGTKKEVVCAMAQLIRDTKNVFARAKMLSYEPIWHDVYRGEGRVIYQHYANDIQDLSEIASINERMRTPVVRAFMERNEGVSDMEHWADIIHSVYCWTKLKKLPKAALARALEIQKRLQIAVESKRGQDAESIRQEFMRGQQQRASQVLNDRDLLRLKGHGRKRMSTIRDIGHKGRDALHKIYPVLLMSPDSMCQILPLETGVVDLAIVDEASQMFFADAMPILYRAKKIVVSGDNMQMPPDEFFTLQDSEGQDDEEIEDDTGDAESKFIPPSHNELLEATDALVGNMRRNLNVHYRSYPAELIAFSNHAFYDGRLQAAPNNNALPEPLRASIDVVHVPGNFEKSINNEEVEEIIVRLRQIWSVPSPLSVGVIVFNVHQANLLKERLEEECEKDADFRASYDKSLNQRDEDEDVGFFVRSVEHVQGDERDVIILGTTYNNKGAYPSLSAQEKGRRRLNVAITRAKHGMIVITSLVISEISNEGDRPDGEGAGKERWYLWKFMEYARAVSTGAVEVAVEILRSLNRNYKPSPTGREPDSQFEIDVADYIRGLGYVVDYQIGESGFRIDLGVKQIKEERYLCGIECDGRIWHEGWRARHNDVWRQKILENKGWNIYRIWSDRWYDHPDDTKKKLFNYLKERVLNQR